MISSNEISTMLSNENMRKLMMCTSDDDVLDMSNNHLDGDMENDSNDGRDGTVGRWTREEHLLFIRGLELYGKGWKKIAGLIKTRTVVQIRTHAQKYFLKLTKARQTGDTGTTCATTTTEREPPPGGIRKKKRKRRIFKNLAIAPILQPYVKQPANMGSNSNGTVTVGGIVINGSEKLPVIDIEDSLYNFLSPSLGYSFPTSAYSKVKRELIALNNSSLQNMSVDARDNDTISISMNSIPRSVPYSYGQSSIHGRDSYHTMNMMTNGPVDQLNQPTGSGTTSYRGAPFEASISANIKMENPSSGITLPINTVEHAMGLVAANDCSTETDHIINAIPTIPYQGQSRGGTTFGYGEEKRNRTESSVSDDSIRQVRQGNDTAMQQFLSSSGAPSTIESGTNSAARAFPPTLIKRDPHGDISIANELLNQHNYEREQILKMKEQIVGEFSSTAVPLWYAKGLSVQSLLRAAENVDWIKDRSDTLAGIEHKSSVHGATMRNSSLFLDDVSPFTQSQYYSRYQQQLHSLNYQSGGTIPFRQDHIFGYTNNLNTNQSSGMNLPANISINGLGYRVGSIVSEDFKTDARYFNNRPQHFDDSSSVISNHTNSTMSYSMARSFNPPAPPQQFTQRSLPHQLIPNHSALNAASGHGVSPANVSFNKTYQSYEFLQGDKRSDQNAHVDTQQDPESGVSDNEPGMMFSSMNMADTQYLWEPNGSQSQQQQQQQQQQLDSNFSLIFPENYQSSYPNQSFAHPQAYQNMSLLGFANFSYDEINLELDETAIQEAFSADLEDSSAHLNRNDAESYDMDAFMKDCGF